MKGSRSSVTNEASEPDAHRDSKGKAHLPGGETRLLPARLADLIRDHHVDEPGEGEDQSTSGRPAPEGIA